jgi:hypothetical protein
MSCDFVTVQGKPATSFNRLQRSRGYDDGNETGIASSKRQPHFYSSADFEKLQIRLTVEQSHEMDEEEEEEEGRAEKVRKCERRQRPRMTEETSDSECEEDESNNQQL